MDAEHRSDNRAQHGVITPIQYLRGIAAMLVVLFHAMNKAPGFEDLNSSSFIPNGVDLFFVISGFIMWVTTAGKKVTPRDFMIRRIIRVVPLYWLMTFLMIACSLIPGMLAKLRVSTAAVVQSLLFIPYDSITFPGHAWPVLEPGWTLNYEMFFYTLFALSLALSSRIRFGALVGLICSLTIVGVIFGPFVNPIAATYTGTLLLEFAAGMIVGNLWLRNALRPGFAFSLAAVIAGFVLLGLRPNYSHTVGAVLVVIGCLDPVICTLKSRLLLALGDASYSIYLTHMFALGALGVIWRHAVPHSSLTSAAVFIIAALILCPTMAWFCFRFVEQPITALLQRLALPARPPVLQRA
jgi:exopolysaccharide production protein ExoZ